MASYPITIHIESNLMPLSEPSLNFLKAAALNAVLVIAMEPAEFRVPVRSLPKGIAPADAVDVAMKMCRPNEPDEYVTMIIGEAQQANVDADDRGVSQKKENEPRALEYSHLAAGGWLDIALWGEKNAKITPWEIDFSVNLARQLAEDRPIALKQRPFATKILSKAVSGGWSP